MLASTQQGALQGQGCANRLVMQHIIMMMIFSEWVSLCFWVSVEEKCVGLFFLFPLQQRNTSEYCTGLVFNVFLLKTPLWFECICTKDWCVTWPLNHCGQCDLIRFGSHVKVLWKTNPNCQIIKRIILKLEQRTFTGSWKLQKTLAGGRKVRTYKSSLQTCVLFWRCVPLHTCWVVLAQDWLAPVPTVGVIVVRIKTSFI